MYISIYSCIIDRSLCWPLYSDIYEGTWDISLSQNHNFQNFEYHSQLLFSHTHKRKTLQFIHTCIIKTLFQCAEHQGIRVSGVETPPSLLETNVYEPQRHEQSWNGRVDTCLFIYKIILLFYSVWQNSVSVIRWSTFCTVKALKIRPKPNLYVHFCRKRNIIW